MKPLRAARNAGERARQQTAGAGFGAGDGLAVSGEVFGYGLQGGHGMSFRWAGFPEIWGWVETLLYSGLTLNQYGVASPCLDLKLIHYRRIAESGRKVV